MAANAVLKFISALIAIAHVLSVSIKLLSVSNMLLDYSFGKFKYDFYFLPKSGSVGPLFLSQFACFSSQFRKNLSQFFSVGTIPTPRKNIYIDVPVNRIPDIKWRRLDVGMNNGPSGKSRKDHVCHSLCVSCSCGPRPES